MKLPEEQENCHLADSISFAFFLMHTVHDVPGLAAPK
jgi:hypothetical protein